ncbi:uncharacterized protein LOC113325225 [Papaver somniferum]|uniref:uncharacterized protein LOC113325225 n=1 Tax=Papaver somniferum TaxID=3469 RepID=UPI000E701186|nr:uncharacterized protein LOC113325225 [Papaver somniferum]
MVPTVQNMVQFTINDGNGIGFWNDKWLDEGCLQDLFPEVFKVVKEKDVSIAAMIEKPNMGISDFKRPLNANEKLECDLLRRDVRIPALRENGDVMSIMDNFITSKYYEDLVRQLESRNFAKHLWKNNIPHKVNFIIWVSFHNSHPNRDMLRHRGVEMDSDLCAFCNSERETTDHMFLHCSYSFEVRNYFIKAFRISWPMPKTLFDLFEAWSTNLLQGRGKLV